MYFTVNHFTNQINEISLKLSSLTFPTKLEINDNKSSTYILITKNTLTNSKY